jgi:hypothetical protein
MTNGFVSVFGAVSIACQHLAACCKRQKQQHGCLAAAQAVPATAVATVFPLPTSQLQLLIILVPCMYFGPLKVILRPRGGAWGFFVAAR